MVVLTHEIGRIAGPLWVLFGLLLYFGYRWRQHLPLVGTLPRDWAKDVIAVYRESGEEELIEEYEENLERYQRWRKAHDASKDQETSE